MLNNTPFILLTTCLTVLTLACDANDDALELEQPIVIDAVELEAQLAEDPTTRVVVDLRVSEAGYVLDQSEAPMAFEALLWQDGSTAEPVDFLTMTAARGVTLDTPVISIRPNTSPEGFRGVCATFPLSQTDLFCEEDTTHGDWICCTDGFFSGP